MQFDEDTATSVLYAMLHVDEGVTGTYESDVDVPAKEGDDITMTAFNKL